MAILEALRSGLTARRKRALRRGLGVALAAVPHRHSLRVLALKHGTDKLAHGYLEHYQAVFAPLRRRRLAVLEIGVGGYAEDGTGGGSLRMWRDFFPRSTIYGIDIEDKRFLSGPRIRVFQGSQNDPPFLETVVAQTGALDIVIDDGSHQNEHVLTSFRALFPRVRDGGLYVIEDLFTSYWPQYGGSFDDLDRAASSTALLKSLLDGLHHDFIPGREAGPFDRSVAGLLLFPKIAFVLKGRNEESLPGFLQQEKEKAGSFKGPRTR